MMTLSKELEALRAANGSARDLLAEHIEGEIAKCASGRIRDLHVVCEVDRIIVQGRSRTYHAKQLALQAILELTDGRPVFADQIVVS
jgi:hypothetical protein